MLHLLVELSGDIFPGGFKIKRCGNGFEVLKIKKRTGCEVIGLEYQEKDEVVRILAQILGVKAGMIKQALSNLAQKKGYLVWKTPKKGGGERELQQAQEPLHELQIRIAMKIYPHSVSAINHSYVSGRSHRTAMAPHLQGNAFFAFDIKDAYPSVGQGQVQSALEKIGYEKLVAALMAHLCCYSPDPPKVEGHLPQGYTSSPYLFNLVLEPIDQILEKFGEARGYNVSRYADNFLLSTPQSCLPPSDRKEILKIVTGLSYGRFKIPVEKTEYFEVTGDTVNFTFIGLAIRGPRQGERKVCVSDDKLAEYYWTIYDALEHQDFSHSMLAHIQGQIRYLRSVYKKRPLPDQVAELYEEYKIAQEVHATGQLYLPFPQK